MRVNGPRVLVKRLTDLYETKTDHIHLVKLDFEPSQHCKVVEIGTYGPHRVSLPDIKIGDKVITKVHCGTPVTLEGGDYEVVMYDDILAVLED